MLLSCGGGGSSAQPSDSTPPPAAPVETEIDGVRCLFDADDLRAKSLTLGTGFAVEMNGSVLVQAGQVIYEAASWVPLTTEALQAPLDFGVDPAGTIFAVSGKAFGLIVGGGFTRLTELPAAGYRLAVASPELVYLYGPAPDGRSVVFMLRRSPEGTSTVQQVLTVDGAIGRLAPFGRDFVFSQGAKLYQAGPTSSGRTAVIPMFSLEAGEDVVGIVHDAATEMLFVSSRDGVYAARGRTSTPILGFGGPLAYGDALYVLQSSEQAAFRVDVPKLLAALASRAKARKK
jgi:hypothetical protein